MTTRKEKIEQTLDIVHKLEDRYGSIDKTPANRPEFKITHGFYEEHEREVRKATDDDIKAIKELWEQKLSDVDIADELFIDSSTVTHWRSKLGKPNRTVYYLRRGMEREQFKSLIELSNFLGYSYQRNYTQLQEEAKKRGWTIREKMSHDY